MCFRAVARGRAETHHALSQGLLRQCVEPRAAARVDLWRERDDVGLTRGQPEHARPAAADHQRRMRPLERPRQDPRAPHRVVLALVVDALLAQEPLQEDDRLLEPAHAHRGRVVRDAELAVVADVPPRADADLDTAT